VKHRFTEVLFRVQLLFIPHKQNSELIKLPFFLYSSFVLLNKKRGKEEFTRVTESCVGIKFPERLQSTLTPREENTGEMQLFWQSYTQFMKVLEKNERNLFCSDTSKMKKI